MVKKIFPFIALFLSAFLLFSPQTSEAASCKCVFQGVVGYGDVTDCIKLLTDDNEYEYDFFATDCEDFKTKYINRNSSEANNINAADIKCESFNDDACSKPGTEGIDSTHELLWWEFDIKTKKPVLEINIPGLRFSNVVSSSDANGTFYYIPWIPELISALYNFSLGIVSIVAVIIIIVQGIRIVTSAGGEGKSTAYKKIGQAVIGLLIAWGSFAILYNINPATTEFNALKVKTVEPKILELLEKEMQTGTKPTIENDETQPADEYAPTFTNCPITLTNPFTSVGEPLQPRTKEFYEKIGTVITATTRAARILQVAEAAANCNVAFGNCGRTAGNIYTLAGLKDKKKYPNKDCLLTGDGCKTFGAGEVHAIPTDLYRLLQKKDYKCENFGTPQCTEAKNKFIEVYRNDSRLIKDGWPDKIANTLRAGDVFWGYTGAPLHSMIFVKWTANPGYAEVIDGGPSQKVKKRYRCLLSSCSNKSFTPVVRTFDPNKLDF